MIKSYWFVLKQFMKIDKFNIISYLVNSIILIPLTILELALTQNMVTQISSLSSKNISTNIYLPIIFLFGILYVNGIVSSLKAINETNLTEYGLYQQEKIILEKTLKLSITNLDNTDVKDLKEKAKRLDLTKITTTFTNFFTNILSFIILTAILIAYKSVYIIFIVLILLLLDSYIEKWSSKKLEAIEQKQTASNRFTQYLFHLLTSRESIQEIRVFTVCKYLKSKFKDIYMKNYKEVMKAKNRIREVNSISKIIVTTINVVCIIILIVIINENKFEVGVYVLLTQILNQLMGVMSTIATNFSDIKVINMQFEQYQKFLQIDEIPQDRGSKEETLNKDAALRIAFHNVTFQYPRTQVNALENINLQIEPGEKVAIVGKNGSGKSTFIKLVLGLYSPSAGNIEYTLDGKKLEYYKVAYYSRVVFQDFVKLLRPIRENIAIGKIKDLNDDEKLLAALGKAHSNFHENQFDEYIGPEFGGTEISGGQWQSLAIARAYLDDGAMIIFDEATSALDPQAELKQLQEFLSLGKNRTSIFITHRLSVAKFVDKIAVFDGGHIVEYGSHKQLYEAGGLYYQMFEAQSSFYM